MFSFPPFIYGLSPTVQLISNRGRDQHVQKTLARPTQSGNQRGTRK